MTTPPQVRVERVYDRRTPQEGARVLVDRLWPRGLTHEQADLDAWCAPIAPSAALRVWYRHDPDRFAEFRRRYRIELDDPVRAPALAQLRKMAQSGTLTLLTASTRVEISQAVVLVELLDPETRIGR